MTKKQILGLVSAVVMAVSMAATAMGYGPIADEIKESVCK